MRILRFLGSMRFAVVILLVLGVVLAWATVVDSQYGSAASSFAIYHSWWFLCLCGLLGVSVLTSALVRYPWRKEQSGFLLTHLGILVLMGGCAMTLWYGQDATLGIFEGTSNGIATADSLHFQLKIQPLDESKKGEERSIPFQPGPFSWEFYRGGPFFAVGVGEKLPQFPWRWIPSSRTRPVLCDDEGIRLEVLDYRTRVEMVPVSQQRQIEIVQNGQRETFFLSHARMDQRPRTASGEAIVYKKAANAEEVSAFLQCRPEFGLLKNPAKEGLVTLWLEGKVYFVPLNQLPLGKIWQLPATQWQMTLLRVEPEINMAKLVVEKGETRAELTLVADSPEMSTQGYAEKIYGYLWTQAEVLEYTSPDGQPLPVSEEERSMKPMMERMRKLIDCPRLEILESPDGKWYARAWKRPDWVPIATPEQELRENQSVEVFPKTPNAMSVKILPIPKEDIPGYAIVPVPLKDWRLSGMEKKGLDLKFVKIALEVDGNRYEGWIRAQLPDPTFPEPSAAEWELISLPGKERTVTVSLAPDQVDLGFRLFLNRFHRRLDPGTSMAAHYSSEVSLLDRESEEVRRKNIRIHLNQPVDFADPQTHRIWRVYQSSFRGPILPNDPLFQKVVPAGDLREQLYISWFTVNHAPGRGLLYLGCLLMVLGMTLLGMRKIQGKKAGEGRVMTIPKNVGRTFFLLMSFLVGTAGTLTADAAEPAEPKSWDWSHWETLPVFHQGRIMPLDALARLEVLQICGREKPRLVFQGEKRSFRSSEIFFSWLVEPELWEDVPFLPLEKEVLRTRMGLPRHDAAGVRLSKVSPAETIRFYTSPEYERLVAELEAAKKTSPDGNYPPAEKELFDALTQLERQIMAYRALTFHPQTAGTLRTEFMERLVSVMQTWSMGLQPGISKMPLANKSLVEKISAHLQTLGQLFWKDGQEQNTQSVSLEALAVPTGALVRDSETLAKEVETYILQLLRTPAPEGISPPQWQYVQSQSRTHWVQMKRLAIQCNELQYALYDDGMPLNILPSLDAAPLDAWRDESVQMHPWLSLHALLYGSWEGILQKFPEKVHPTIDAIRQAFSRMVQAWKAKRGEDFTQASEQFAEQIQVLAQKTGSIRKNLLPKERRDDEILYATAYPTDSTNLRREVFYYHLTPFLWGWVFPFVAFLLLGLAGIFSLVLAQSKDSGGIFPKIRYILWILGLVFLAVGVGFTTWGLALRSWIMGRAPVTNMFETIVFVSWTAGVMGIWLSLRQILEPAFSFGWQATSPGGEKEAAARKIAWGLLPVRLALMGGIVWLLTCAGFGLGEGYNVISLTPRLAIGATFPSLSDQVVWLTGILTLDVLVWWIPRVVLTPVGAGYWLWKERGSWNVGGDQKIWFALATSLIVFLISYIAYSCTSLFNANLRNLMPILRDNYWLSVHVITIVASYGAGMLAWALGNLSLLIYALGKYPEVDGKRREPAICQTLSELIYRCMQAAVLLLVIGTILGGLWADVSWGRFWSWDRKEVWALISLLVYLLILHGRYVRLLGEMTLPIGSVLGAMAIIMAWYGVNYILGSALHGYGAGVGSLKIFFLVAGGNALLILLAVGRYWGMLGTQTEWRKE